MGCEDESVDEEDESDTDEAEESGDDGDENRESLYSNLFRRSTEIVAVLQRELLWRIATLFCRHSEEAIEGFLGLMLGSRVEVDDVDDVDVDVLFNVVIGVFSCSCPGTTGVVEESVFAALASEVLPPARGKKPRQHSAPGVARMNTNRTLLCTEIGKPLKHTMTGTQFQQSQLRPPTPTNPIPTESSSAKGFAKSLAMLRYHRYGSSNGEGDPCINSQFRCCRW
jgi:hypothetical protein